jgi:hypothetical protein
MSTVLYINRVRASALAALIARKYPRLPYEAIPSLPEVQGLSRSSIEAMIDIAVEEAWIEQNEHGEVVAPCLHMGQTA